MPLFNSPPPETGQLVSFVEFGRSLLHELLVHQGDAEVVQLGCLGPDLRVVSPSANGEQTHGDNAGHEPAERRLHSGCLLRDNGESNLDYKVSNPSRSRVQPPVHRSGPTFSCQSNSLSLIVSPLPEAANGAGPINPCGVGHSTLLSLNVGLPSPRATRDNVTWRHPYRSR